MPLANVVGDMAISWNDLWYAHISAIPGEIGVWVHRKTGEFRDHWCEVDNEGPPPNERRGWVPVPSARELDLERGLVERFIAAHCPNEKTTVYRKTAQRKAWSAFNQRLKELDLYDKWHAFKDEATQRALLEWAEVNGVTILDTPTMP